MKKCSFCEQEVQDSALYCQSCGQSLTGEKKKRPLRWYCRTPSLVIGFFIIGPLILPAVWMNPQYSRRTKIIITLIVLAATVVIFALVYSTGVSTLNDLKSYYQEYEDILNKSF